MQQTQLTAVAVALLLALVPAGATAGVGAPAVGDATLAQGNGTNATAGNASVNESVLPPGVSPSGVTNASVLVAAHEEALASSGYEFTFVQNYSVETGPNQSLPPALADTRAVQNGTVAEGLAPFVVHTETERETPNRTVSSTVDYYGNESVVTVRAVRVNQTQFRTYQRDGNATGQGAFAQPSFDAVVTKSRIIAGVLRSGEFTVAGTERAGNHTLVTLEATEYAGTLGVSPENVTEYNATVVVDERGLVHSFEFTLASTTRSIPVRLQYGFNVTQRDVNVTKPAWVSEALASAGDRVSVGTQNRTYLTVTNDGDRPLPPGTTVTVVRDGSETTLEVSQPLRPGTTAFVAFPGGEPTLSVGSPPEGDAQTLSGSYEVTVQTPQGQLVGQASFTFGNATGGNATAA